MARSMLSILVMHLLQIKITFKSQNNLNKTGITHGYSDFYKQFITKQNA